MSEVCFETSEACKLVLAYIDQRPQVAQCVSATFDLPQGSVVFRLEWLEGNRWAVWYHRENNGFDDAFEAKTIEDSREYILVDDAGLLNVEMSSREFLERQGRRRPEPYIHLGGRAGLSGRTA
jgi:hypothetical protein